METKELHSMSKHRGLFLALGLTALIGLTAREAGAASMTLTVSLNGTQIYTVTGTQQAVSAVTTTLNSDLSGTGYTFSSLSGASNNTGTSALGFISDSGNLSFTPGGSGGVLTISVAEAGFTAPVGGGGATLTSTSTANYSAAQAGTDSTTPSYDNYTGMFTDSTSPTPVTATTPLIVLPANGGQADNHTLANSVPIPPYIVPYTLTSTTTIDLTSPAGATSPANDVFTGKTSVVSAAVPEPASIVMMLTGMPLPLVVMGLLRRRRRAAA
jgi:hypothetical protein